MCSNTPPPVITAQPDCSYVAFSNRAVLKYILHIKNDVAQTDNGHSLFITVEGFGLIECPDVKTGRKLC